MAQRKMEKTLMLDPSSLLTTEVCVGSVVLMTILAVLAAAVTIYRQRSLLGSQRETGEGEEKQREHAGDGDDNRDEVFTGRWPTNENEEVESSEETKRDRDPLEFCEHIPGEMKRVKQRMAEKKIEEEMTEDQREIEREVKRQQMESIFRLLKEQEEKFGIGSLDDMDRQMSMYYNIN